MSDRIALFWFRRDLRLDDNPALSDARASGARIAPVYVLDDAGPFALGGAGRWWLHHSLAALNDRLKTAGAPLILRRGDSEQIILELARTLGAEAVYWNRRYDPHGVAVDGRIKSALKASGVSAHSRNGSLLREPWEVETKTGGPYRVFTPFWRALQAIGPARDAPSPEVRKLNGVASPTDRLEDWALTPSRPNLASAFPTLWTPGEKGAKARLKSFIAKAAGDYDEARNRPDMEGTSRLSPHLAFGELSPLQVWRAGQASAAAGARESGVQTFLSEIAWREFSYVLHYHFPELHVAPMKADFANFPWRDDEAAFARWTRGETGFPIVDAGMRQLWRTGWMHNRVRMIVASFLVKNMMVHWTRGERWFWDTLVDADPASNAASWQWVAGSGADAAPYFRIFNPVTQAQKFDPNGDYVRQFVSELEGLDAKHIHAPYAAPAAAVRGAGVHLGESYPFPMLDLKETRTAALAAYDAVRNP